MVLMRYLSALILISLFVLAACGSDGDLTGTGGLPDGNGGDSGSLTDGVPTPGSSTFIEKENCRGGIHWYYTSNSAPNTLGTAYEAALKQNGWKIIERNISGFGSTLVATSGSRYLVYNVGGPPYGMMHINLCVWPSKPSDTDCGNCD